MCDGVIRFSSTVYCIHQHTRTWASTEHQSQSSICAHTVKSNSSWETQCIWHRSARETDHFVGLPINSNWISIDRNSVRFRPLFAQRRPKRNISDDEQRPSQDGAPSKYSKWTTAFRKPVATCRHARTHRTEIAFRVRFQWIPFRQDEAFNVNLAIFLSQLKTFKQNPELSINQATLDMLSDTVYTIDNIIENAPMNGSTDRNDVDFIFNLPSDLYKIRPYISCRLCSVGCG